ncbi:SGNH/GDSL hydrolase family protein [Capnocytophaga canimorsus]|uniref:Secreted protein n=1 Tax=Capnocytophaga canimorsus (strain 5) TaxID=860228 RepID=F9YQI3_CAPCC|nr:lipase [Capnocytophaga canimorsus]AEK23522.1 Putative secreted protein [Capnocytophaga canimorsus Cc5]WGU70847.1 lipase [Capnocytophaga canimorsus]CEN44915.1 putative secreted protein [Capnocytophaga canimorsus]
MKKIFLIVTFLISIISWSQTTTIKTKIPFKQSDETAWIKRYQHDIDKYKKENKNLPNKQCDVLFLGSSSINLWKTIYEDFAPLKVIRRSYGGSTLRDMIYNYKVIAKGYNPKKILLYVENDLGSHKEGVSAVKCFDLFRIFIAKLKKDYPNSSLYVVSLKPSEHKADQIKDQLLVNSFLEANAKEQNYIYIDITKVMYDTEGNLRQDIFVEDKLHLNTEGYRLWTEVIKPYLIK